MKKSVLTLAVAICAVLSMSAQAPASRTMPGDLNKMYQPREFTDFAFEGILLDIDQQTRIDSLHAAIKAQCPVPAQCGQAQLGDKAAKCDRADAKCDKKCDKADAKCDKKGPKGHKGRPAASASCPLQNPDYMAKVKEILTPDQYVTFLENIVTMQQKAPAPAKRDMHRPRMHKGPQVAPSDSSQNVKAPKAKKAKR